MYMTHKASSRAIKTWQSTVKQVCRRCRQAIDATSQGCTRVVSLENVPKKKEKLQKSPAKIYWKYFEDVNRYLNDMKMSIDI